jgi:ribose 5-phosphate isomerase A
MKKNQDSLKQKVAYAVLDNIKLNPIIGLGSGSTVGYFIEALASIKHKIEGVVAASVQTENQLKPLGIPILDLNTVNELSIYIDSTDEVNSKLQLIKGGGGALTREKIIAAVSQCFICIADESKYVKLLGQRVVPIEVIPIARSYVAREIVKLGGFPIYRENFITDNGNVILDTQDWDFTDPIRLEKLLNNISGTVCNGIFAQRPADKLLLANSNEIKIITRPR